MADFEYQESYRGHPPSFQQGLASGTQSRPGTAPARGRSQSTARQQPGAPPWQQQQDQQARELANQQYTQQKQQHTQGRQFAQQPQQYTQQPQPYTDGQQYAHQPQQYNQQYSQQRQQPEYASGHRPSGSMAAHKGLISGGTVGVDFGVGTNTRLDASGRWVEPLPPTMHSQAISEVVSYMDQSPRAADGTMQLRVNPMEADRRDARDSTHPAGNRSGNSAAMPPTTSRQVPAGYVHSNGFSAKSSSAAAATSSQPTNSSGSYFPPASQEPQEGYYDRNNGDEYGNGSQLSPRDGNGYNQGGAGNQQASTYGDDGAGYDDYVEDAGQGEAGGYYGDDGQQYLTSGTTVGRKTKPVWTASIGGDFVNPRNQPQPQRPSSAGGRQANQHYQQTKFSKQQQQYGKQDQERQQDEQQQQDYERQFQQYQQQQQQQTYPQQQLQQQQTYPQQQQQQQQRTPSAGGGPINQYLPIQRAAVRPATSMRPGSMTAGSRKPSILEGVSVGSPRGRPMAGSVRSAELQGGNPEAYPGFEFDSQQGVGGGAQQGRGTRFVWEKADEKRFNAGRPASAGSFSSAQQPSSPGGGGGSAAPARPWSQNGSQGGAYSSEGDGSYGNTAGLGGGSAHGKGGGSIRGNGGSSAYGNSGDAVYGNGGGNAYGNGGGSAYGNKGAPAHGNGGGSAYGSKGAPAHGNSGGSAWPGAHSPPTLGARDQHRITNTTLERARETNLAQNAVPGSPNARLVGGKWSFVEDRFKGTLGPWGGAPPDMARSLTADDLALTRPDNNLGNHVVAGAANARLVGSSWRNVPDNTRTAREQAKWTDHYGPVGGGTERNAYYGRTYNADTPKYLVH